MADKQFKASIDPRLAIKLRACAARWDMSISELIAYCVRRKIEIEPLTDAEMLPPDHPLNADKSTTVVDNI